MPKPPPRNQSLETHTPGMSYEPAGSNSLVEKARPIAEIIFFPNAKEPIAGVPQAQTDPQTRTRWLKLADEVLESEQLRKKA